MLRVITITAVLYSVFKVTNNDIFSINSTDSINTGFLSDLINIWLLISITCELHIDWPFKIIVIAR